MYSWEVKRIIGNYKEDDEISLYVNGTRITGILIDYDDDNIKIKPFNNKEIVILTYEDVEDI